MAEGDLTTTDNAFAWLSISSPTEAQTETVARLITAVSTEIQVYLGYQVAEASYTRTFDGENNVKIMLPDRPIVSVSSVTIDGVSIPAGTPPARGFVWSDKAVALNGYRFCRGFQNVVIAYTAGWSAVPGDIEQACLDWVSQTFKSQLRDNAVKSQKAGDTQETYADPVSMVGKTLIPMPASVFGVLSQRKRVSM